MPDIFFRDEAPLTPGEWALIDATVVAVVKRLQVGRRFPDMFGPLGPGVQDVDYQVFCLLAGAAVSLVGDEDGEAITPIRRANERQPMVYKDFLLFWRELVQGGVYQTQAIRDITGVVLSLGPQNIDLAIGHDLVTAYPGPQGLNHPFRVFETLALRLKRPPAICRLDGPGSTRR